MKNTFRKLALPLAIAALIGAPALANRAISVQAGAVDFTDTDTELAYITLSSVDGSLVVTFADQASSTSLPAIDFLVPDLGREDIFGADVGAELGDIAAVSIDRTGSLATGYDVTHADVSFGAVLTAYVAQLEAAGYTVVVDRSGSTNLASMTATTATSSVRVNLHRFGSNVTANLRVL